MRDSRLDVGFVPVECPGAAGTGATQTSTLLIEELSRRHDLTVYVTTQMDVTPSELPARDRVEYVLNGDLPMLPHPIRNKQEALRGELASLNTHDLVHSYSSAFIPVLADLDVPTVVTLNSYLAVCPTADFRYHGKEHCSGPEPAKCAGCVAATAVNRRQGVTAELKSAYLSAGRFPLVKSSLERCDDITAYQALSPHLRDDYVGVGFDADRIRVIPHFYDERFLVDDDVTPDATGVGTDGGAPVSGPDTPIQLLYVGSLQEIKGADVLVRSLPSLAERGIDIELHVAGRGPLEQSLRTLTDDLGVDDRIVWHGYVDHDDLPELYREADVFVYPGVIEEPFGRVMLEALASRTPIVSSDIGSMDSIVGPAGTLFEAGDPERLAAAVERLLDDYGNYRSAIPDQLTEFSPGSVLDEFDELYRDTARGG